VTQTALPSVHSEVEQPTSSWWRTRRGVQPTLQLPFDRPHCEPQRYTPSTTEIFLPESVRASLKGLAERAGCRLDAATLAVFAVLLHGYTGENDLCIATDAPNRFILLCDLAEDPSFLALLARVQSTLGDSAAHPLPEHGDIDADLTAQRVAPTFSAAPQGCGAFNRGCVVGRGGRIGEAHRGCFRFCV